MTKEIKYLFRGIFFQSFFPVIISIVFFCIIFFLFPFREIIQFDPDEGLNLMRSMLLSLKHILYSEISSDQPPLFTYLLSWLFKFSGFEVNPARIMVLFFAAIMIFSCSQMLRMSWGNLSVILFLPFVLGIPNLIELSVSVMIGIPAISMACLSALMIFFWYRNKLRIYLYFSAFILAMSVLIKLFTIFLAPMIILIIIGSEYFHRDLKIVQLKYFYPAIEWGLFFGANLLLWGFLLIGPTNITQLITPHIAAESYTQYQGYGATINYRLESVLPLLLLAILGLIYSVIKKNKFSYLLALWIGISYILLSFHRPVYAHHQLLITIPAAMLASIGGTESIHFFLSLKNKKNGNTVLWIISSLALIAMFYSFFTSFLITFPKLNNFPKTSGFILQGTPGKINIINTMGSYKEQTTWIFTDLPMYAFRVKKPVPPVLATFSEKRLLTGSLTNLDLLSTVRNASRENVTLDVTLHQGRMLPRNFPKDGGFLVKLSSKFSRIELDIRIC